MLKPALVTLLALLVLVCPATGAEPAPTEPAGAQPAPTEPAGAQPAPTEPAGAQPAADPRAVLDRFIAATDPAKLPEAINQLTDDVYVLDEGLDGQPVRLDGKPAAQAYLQSRSQMLSVSQNTLSDVVMRVGESSAWVVATLNHVVATQEATPWKQLVTFYLRKDASGWKIAGWHASAAELPEEPYEGGPDEMPDGSTEALAAPTPTGP